MDWFYLLLILAFYGLTALLIYGIEKLNGHGKQPLLEMQLAMSVPPPQPSPGGRGGERIASRNSH